MNIINSNHEASVVVEATLLLSGTKPHGFNYLHSTDPRGCGIVVNWTMSWMGLTSPFLYQAVIQALLLLAGDVEQNPGPPKILKRG